MWIRVCAKLSRHAVISRTMKRRSNWCGGPTQYHFRMESRYARLENGDEPIRHSLQRPIYESNAVKWGPTLPPHRTLLLLIRERRAAPWKSLQEPCTQKIWHPPNNWCNLMVRTMSMRTRYPWLTACQWNRGTPLWPSLRRSVTFTLGIMKATSRCLFFSLGAAKT